MKKLIKISNNYFLKIEYMINSFYIYIYMY